MSNKSYVTGQPGTVVGFVRTSYQFEWGLREHLYKGLPPEVIATKVHADLEVFKQLQQELRALNPGNPVLAAVPADWFVWPLAKMLEVVSTAGGGKRGNSWLDRYLEEQGGDDGFAPYDGSSSSSRGSRDSDGARYIPMFAGGRSSCSTGAVAMRPIMVNATARDRTVLQTRWGLPLVNAHAIKYGHALGATFRNRRVYLMADGLQGECTQLFMGLTRAGNPAQVHLHPSIVLSESTFYVGPTLVDFFFSGEWDDVVIEHDAQGIQPMQALDM